MEEFTVNNPLKDLPAKPQPNHPIIKLVRNGTISGYDDSQLIPPIRPIVFISLICFFILTKFTNKKKNLLDRKYYIQYAK